MPIFKKKSGGDLTGAPKRTASKESTAAVMKLQARSQSGFKGEKKNDHGLPYGESTAKKPEVGHVTLNSEPRKKVRPRYDTYANGTQSIEVDPEPKPNMNLIPKAKQAKAFTPELAELPEERNVAKEEDMEKVRAYQTKLNKQGANLKVDGIWGDKTAAASRKLYKKPTSKSTAKTPTKTQGSLLPKKPTTQSLQKDSASIIAPTVLNAVADKPKGIPAKRKGSLIPRVELVPNDPLVRPAPNLYSESELNSSNSQNKQKAKDKADNQKTSADRKKTNEDYAKRMNLKPKGSSNSSLSKTIQKQNTFRDSFDSNGLLRQQPSKKRKGSLL